MRDILTILPLLALSAAFQSSPIPFCAISRASPTISTVVCGSSTEDSIDADTALVQKSQHSSGFTSWSSSWFPLAYTAFTDKKRPTKHYLLGAPIVVWHFNNTWHAMLDKCPHRLVPLSEGRVVPETGDIECPYHGFTFEGSTGQCTRVPQAENTSSLVGIETRGCATALTCVVQQGIIWVHSAPLYGNITDTASLDELKRFNIDPIDRPGVLHVDYFRDLPMDWRTLAENVVDPAHLPFTHHKTISSRTKAVPVPIKLTSFSNNGFTAERLTSTRGSVEFRAPHLIFSTTSRENSFTDWNVVYAIPTLPGKCRLLVRVVFEVSAMKPPLKYIFGVAFRQPKFLLHLNNHKVLEDDNIFLHHQGHNYQQMESFQEGTYLPTSADRAVIAFQRWLKEYKDDRQWSPHTPPGAFFSQNEVLTRDELITRGHTHTVHCTSCLGAKKWLERVEPAFAVGAVLTAVKAFGGSGGVRWSFGVATALFCWLKCKAGGMKKNMQDGEWPPPRNR